MGACHAAASCRMESKSKRVRTKQEAILSYSHRDGMGEAENSEKEHFEAHHPHGL